MSTEPSSFARLRQADNEMTLAVFDNHIRLDSGLVRRRSGAQVPSLNGVAAEGALSKKWSRHCVKTQGATTNAEGSQR